MQVIELSRTISTQTDCILVTEENSLKVFNKTLSNIPLTTCYSFFLENTLVEDPSDVLIDRDVQTLESGGFCKEFGTQCSQILLLANVFTESVLSGTTELVLEYQNEYTDHDDDITYTNIAYDSYTQTLLTNGTSTGENGRTDI